MALPEDNDAAIVMAQEPAPGVEVDEGTVVTVDVRVARRATRPIPSLPVLGK